MRASARIAASRLRAKRPALIRPPTVQLQATGRRSWFSVHPPAMESLRQIALFAGLTNATLDQVAAVAVRHTYAPGEIILLAGEPCSMAGFIVQGEVRIYRLVASGREQVLARLGPGAAFNTVPPFRPEGRNPANVQALTETTLYSLPGAALRDLVRRCPDLALVLLEDFAARLEQFTDLVEDLALRSVRGRLARFLLEQAAVADAITPRWTQDEIAARLGTVRDVVGRTLRAFCDAGLIRLERQRIILLDRAGLEAEASN